MTRLINADALEKAIYEWMPKDQSTWMDSDLPPIENLVVSIMMTIQEQPAVDAVEVVRCKDCKWGREACGNIECHVDLNIPSEYHGYDWYCPNGERKEE